MSEPRYVPKRIWCPMRSNSIKAVSVGSRPMLRVPQSILRQVAALTQARKEVEYCSEAVVPDERADLLICSSTSSGATLEAAGNEWGPAAKPGPAPKAIAQSRWAGVCAATDSLP